MAWFKSDYAQEKRSDGHLKGHGSKLLSAAYKAYLGTLVDEQTRRDMKLPEGSTWADAIALQTVKRAVGQVGKDNICFTAITELRETTEGKTAEKIIATGNEELQALAAAITGQPAPIPEDNPSTSSDSRVGDAE